MLEQARESAARRHYPMMVEAVLRANGFPEAAEWIHQPHIYQELKDIAERARKEAVGLSTMERADLDGTLARFPEKEVHSSARTETERVFDSFRLRLVQRDEHSFFDLS